MIKSILCVVTMVSMLFFLNPESTTAIHNLSLAIFCISNVVNSYITLKDDITFKSLFDYFDNKIKSIENNIGTK